MKNIKQTQEVVREVLEEYPETRNSDDLLYVKVCARINAVAVNLPFHRVFLNRKELSIPPFESVRRARQKLQAQRPDLAGCDEVETHRTMLEETYRDYARASH